MEKKYEGLTLFEFQKKFPDNDSCQNFLAEMKWSDGFKCEKCQNNTYCRGKLFHTRQCTKCRYQATPTSGTLFHKVKFPMLKTFYILYYYEYTYTRECINRAKQKTGATEKNLLAVSTKGNEGHG